MSHQLPGRVALACALLLPAGARAQLQPAPAPVTRAIALPEPHPSLRQHAHAAWTRRNGAPGGVSAIAQTADGYLWLGGATGLFRFDGVRFSRWEPPPGESLSSANVSALTVTEGDSLWIGYRFGGVSVLAGGRLRHYGQRDSLPPATVRQIGRDSAGVMVLATEQGIFTLRGGRWHREAEGAGLPRGRSSTVLTDRRGNLWVNFESGVYVRRRGAERFESWGIVIGPTGRPGLAEAPDGSIWGAGWLGGLTLLADPSGARPPAGTRPVGDSAQTLLFDPEGNAWVGAGGGQVSWFRRPADAGPAFAERAAREHMLAAEGLSSRTVWMAFRDREGSIWHGTPTGLDRFRPTKLTPVQFPVPFIYPAIVAGDSGTLWVKNRLQPLYRLAGGGAEPVPAMTVPVTVAHRDAEGTLWYGAGDGTLWQLRADGSPLPVALPPEVGGRIMQAIARARDGTLWISVHDSGTFRRRGDAWERFRPERRFRSPPIAITADGAGRTWLTFPNNLIARVIGDSVTAYTPEEGVRVGVVAALHVRGDRVWAGGEGGLLHLDAAAPGAAFHPLVATDGPFRGVTGIVERADGELWLNATEGISRIPAAEVRRALGDTAYRVHAERFDHRDGVLGTPPSIAPLPSVIEGTDGRLWFALTDGLLTVDPARIRRNALAPSVIVEALTVGDRSTPVTARRIELAPRTTALQLAYAATSLAVPDRVRFRYRLVGLDTAWRNAGARREASFTNLDPGSYRFEVVAANEDGVWSPAPATLDLTIQPTFVQTSGFLVLCIAGALGAAWAFMQWRQRRAAAALEAQFAAVLAERMRVARELHDTLLTEVAGLALFLDAAAARAAARSAAASDEASLLERLAAQARRTVDEARRAVVGMRTSADDVPIDERLRRAAARIFDGGDVAARVETVGTPRRYAPLVEEEAMRVACEALTNVRRHAQCRKVTVTCEHGADTLRLRVRDDGRGFDSASAPAMATIEGHYGLAGMHERAAALGARLRVESAPGEGTTVELELPQGGRGVPGGSLGRAEADAGLRRGAGPPP